jgi:hypothetical protein
MLSGGEPRGEVAGGHRAGMLELCPHTCGHPGAHPRRAGVDHHWPTQSANRLEKRMRGGIVHRVMPHDRMKMEAEDPMLLHRGDRLGDRLVAVERIDGAPCLDEGARMTVTQAGHIAARPAGVPAPAACPHT